MGTSFDEIIDIALVIDFEPTPCKLESGTLIYYTATEFFSSILNDISSNNSAISRIVDGVVKEINVTQRLSIIHDYIIIIFNSVFSKYQCTIFAVRHLVNKQPSLSLLIILDSILIDSTRVVHLKCIIRCGDNSFITRFFHNQFKRNCIPDGPKVGTVSVSPRGDLRMPSDADSSNW